MSTEPTWRTRVTDRLREMLLPALTISIVSSVWILGHARELEDRNLESFAIPLYELPPADPETTDLDEADEPLDIAASTPPAPATEPVGETLTSIADE